MNLSMSGLLAFFLFLFGARFANAFLPQARIGHHLDRRVLLLPSPSSPSSPLSSLTKKKAPPSSISIHQRSTTSSNTILYYKLWERLQIEEDIETRWYLLNCIVGNELELLKQCRGRCNDYKQVDKFVVPVERKTRSHGASRMVTDVKPKYPGYVFAKLRLCEETYEAIQDLDLCRSWMGTVNRKGAKKMPPAPAALNYEEIEKFGLEEFEEGTEFDFEPEEVANEDGIIVDSDETDAKLEKKFKGVDPEQLKVYKGIAVDDMVKITGSNKFKGEDGIVKRLKEGQVMVRFFTYGSSFDAWLDPKDMRKMKNEEVLRGLSGPSGPITGDDLDGGDGGRGGRWSGDNRAAPGGLRNSLMNNMSGYQGQRNTRRDRTQRGDRFQRDERSGGRDQRQQEQRNWEWYQNQQQNNQQRGGQRNDFNRNDFQRNTYQDPMSDVDSQWGRNSERRQPRDRRTNDGPAKRFNQPRNEAENRRNENALEGDDDWSSFVTPGGPKKNTKPRESEDDFFNSLMSELNEDMGEGEPTSNKNGEDDFFSSLASDLQEDLGEKSKQQPPKRQKRQQQSPPRAGSDSDFFASLEAELSGSLGGDSPFDSSDTSDALFSTLEAEMAGPKADQSKKVSSEEETDNDFFAQLEKEVSGPSTPNESMGGGWNVQNDRESAASAPSAAKVTEPSSDNMDNDFFAQLEKELGNPFGTKGGDDNSDDIAASEKSDDSEKAASATVSVPTTDTDFFSQLEAEISNPSPSPSLEGGGDSTSDFFASLEAELQGAPNSQPATKPVANGIKATKQPSTPQAETMPASKPAIDTSTKVAEPTGSTTESLGKNTVPVLKQMLKDRGLKVGGKKAELIQRLIEHH